MILIPICAHASLIDRSFLHSWHLYPLRGKLSLKQTQNPCRGVIESSRTLVPMPKTIILNMFDYRSRWKVILERWSFHVILHRDISMSVRQSSCLQAFCFHYEYVCLFDRLTDAHLLFLYEQILFAKNIGLNIITF